MTRREFTAAFAMAVNTGKLSEAVALIERATSSGEVWSASLAVRQGAFALDRAFGRVKSPEAPFLLASITKPMTVTAAMVLADRGKIALPDAVHKHIPEFTGGDRGLITVKHLLTHTSGLPDMVAGNTDLRKRHAPLKDFVAAVCREPLLFRPGSQVRYQSMGILLAAEIVERVSGRRLRDFLGDEVYAPLGLRNTFLGMGGRAISSTAECQVPEKSDWDWNSPYWRDLGAPWGGAHSTAADVARFLQAFLDPQGKPVRRETAREMISLQTAGLNDRWGIGWMLKPGNFGAACSEKTFGHYGATGTAAWADPETKLVCVLLTTKPAAQSRDGLLGPVSDAVSRAARG